jgi:hypothetical protein
MHQPLHRPTIVLDMDKFDPADHMCYPQTPPLSSAGSVMGSPGSCDMLATPLNPMFSGLENTPMCIKEEVDALPIEQFPALDWDSCASPPMTPGKFVYIVLVSFAVLVRFDLRKIHATMTMEDLSPYGSLFSKRGFAMKAPECGAFAARIHAFSWSSSVG